MAASIGLLPSLGWRNAWFRRGLDLIEDTPFASRRCRQGGCISDGPSALWRPRAPAACLGADPSAKSELSFRTVWLEARVLKRRSQSAKVLWGLGWLAASGGTQTVEVEPVFFYSR